MNPLYPEGKLVRGRIPALIRERGDDAVVYVAGEDEVCDRLFTKLVEEVLELLSAETVEEQIRELGDVMDVADALRARLGVDLNAFDAMRAQKAASYGDFSEGYVLIPPRRSSSS